MLTAIGKPDNSNYEQKRQRKRLLIPLPQESSSDSGVLERLNVRIIIFQSSIYCYGVVDTKSHRYNTNR